MEILQSKLVLNTSTGYHIKKQNIQLLDVPGDQLLRRPSVRAFA